MQRPQATEGIEDVCDRLARLNAGPFPPVSSVRERSDKDDCSVHRQAHP